MELYLPDEGSLLSSLKPPSRKAERAFLEGMVVLVDASSTACPLLQTHPWTRKRSPLPVQKACSGVCGSRGSPSQ